MKSTTKTMEQDYICKEQCKGKSVHWLNFSGHSGPLHDRGELPDLIIKSKTFIWLRPQTASPAHALPPPPAQASKPQPTLSPASQRCCGIASPCCYPREELPAAHALCAPISCSCGEGEGHVWRAGRQHAFGSLTPADIKLNSTQREGTNSVRKRREKLQPL